MPESLADPVPGPSGPVARRIPADAGAPVLFVGVALLIACASGVALTGELWPGIPTLAAAPATLLFPAGRAPRPWRVTAVVIAALAVAVVAATQLAGDVHEPWGWAAWLAAALALTEVASSVRTRTAHLHARIRAEQQARAAMAVRDGLTDIANRSGIDMVAAPMIENARRKGEAVHALYLDLDGFHVVNDALGASAGDELLVTFASALVGATRSTDIVGRWAGDEFVVIGPGVGTSPLEMERRLRARLEKEPAVPPQVWQPRVSIGSATLVPWDEGDLESLLQRAQQDMQLRRSLRRQQALPRRTSEEPNAGPGGPGWVPTGWDALRSGQPSLGQPPLGQPPVIGRTSGEQPPVERRRPGRGTEPTEPTPEV